MYLLSRKAERGVSETQRDTYVRAILRYFIHTRSNLSEPNLFWLVRCSPCLKRIEGLARVTFALNVHDAAGRSLALAAVEWAGTFARTAACILLTVGVVTVW